MTFLDNSSEEEHSQETKTWLELVLVVFLASLELCHPSQMTLPKLAPCSNICVNFLLIDLNNWNDLQIARSYLQLHHHIISVFTSSRSPASSTKASRAEASNDKREQKEPCWQAEVTGKKKLVTTDNRERSGLVEIWRET